MNNALAWDGNWAWSLPLIVITVIFHVLGLGIINQRIIVLMRRMRLKHHFLLAFGPVMGLCTLWTTLLHALEAGMWAAVYLALHALSDGRLALLYSLSAMTTYGHESFDLAPHWQLMGSLEALNGMILFGLTTAFLFNMIREVWPQSQEGHEEAAALRVVDRSSHSFSPPREDGRS
jgi:hypothetical protein